MNDNEDGIRQADGVARVVSVEPFWSSIWGVGF